jgi:hypothetical protein
MVFAPTAAADAAQAHVLTHDGFDLGQIEDLVTDGFVAIDMDRRAAVVALRGWQAFDAVMDVLLGHHGPKAAFVAGLPTEWFAAFGFAGACRGCGAVAGGWLGGVA